MVMSCMAGRRQTCSLPFRLACVTQHSCQNIKCPHIEKRKRMCGSYADAMKTDLLRKYLERVVREKTGTLLLVKTLMGTFCTVSTINLLCCMYTDLIRNFFFFFLSFLFSQLNKMCKISHSCSIYACVRPVCF